MRTTGKLLVDSVNRALMTEGRLKFSVVQGLQIGSIFSTLYAPLYYDRKLKTLLGELLEDFKLDSTFFASFAMPKGVYLETSNLSKNLLELEKHCSKAEDPPLIDVNPKFNESDKNAAFQQSRILSSTDFEKEQEKVLTAMGRKPSFDTNLLEATKEVDLISVLDKICVFRKFSSNGLPSIEKKEGEAEVEVSEDESHVEKVRMYHFDRDLDGLFIPIPVNSDAVLNLIEDVHFNKVVNEAHHRLYEDFVTNAFGKLIR